MLEEYGRVIISCIAGLISGTLLGNGAVYFFNKIPGKWFCDYGEEPDEELIHPTEQRVKSTPWKYVFSGLFIIISIWLILYKPGYAVAALAACWLLLEMAIADVKYRIIPDQLVLLLLVTGLGFIPFHRGGPIDGLWGALIGFGVMLLIGILGKLLYKKESLGGGDIKLFGALGLATGVDGIIIIFILTTLLSAAHTVYLLLRKKIKITDHRPMAPYIAVSSGIYLVLLHQIGYNITIYL